VYDPAERDRATATHRRLENWLLDRLEREGIRPLDPQGSVEFDLAWLERDGSLTVCEVKSTSGHEDGQIRLGLGQVLHYAARLRSGWPRSINPVLFIEDDPSDPVWLPLCDEHGVVLSWPAAWDALRAPGATTPVVDGGGEPEVQHLGDDVGGLEVEGTAGELDRQRLPQAAPEQGGGLVPLLEGDENFGVHAADVFGLDKGQVVEQGTHSELVENSILYKHLHELQFSSDEETEGLVAAN
jgi:hypothetical protein